MAEKILLVGPEPPPTGGIASHVASLCRALGKIGVASTLVDSRQRLRFVTELGRAGARGDVVHLHVCGHNRSSYGLLGACLAATPVHPAMVTLHSGLLPGYLSAVTRTGRRTIAGLLRRASAVVAVSDQVARAVRELGVDAIVASPFIADGMRRARPPSRVSAIHAAGERIIAAAVAPGPEYGLDVLVGGFARIAAMCHDVVLVVYGAGGADREVARRLVERGLSDRVVPLGELAPAVSVATLALADVVVRPTLADGDAITVREARALGRHVVASDVTARPPGTTLFPAGDSHAMAEAVLTALRTPAPPASIEDGLAPLLRLYSRMEVAECVASPAV